MIERAANQIAGVAAGRTPGFIGMMQDFARQPESELQQIRTPGQPA
jgi:hypothetical protein